MKNPMLESLDGIFIMHTAFEKVLTEVEETIEDGESLLEAPNLCVTGPAGIGKSTLVHKLEERHPRRKDAIRLAGPGGVEAICDEIPLLVLEMPSQPTANKLARRMLRHLGDKFWTKGKNDTLDERVQNYVAACGVKAIVIDEAQRAVDRDGVVRGEHLAEWLKELHGTLNVCFFLVGMARVRHLLDFDDQIDRRWDEEVAIPPYEWGDDLTKPIDGRASFITLLATYKDRSPIPFGKDVDIYDEEVAKRFYYASRGVLGLLKKLLLRAAFIATRRHEEVLTAEYLRLGYDRAFRKEKQHENLINPWGPEWDGRLPPPLRDHSALRRPKLRSQHRPRKREKRARLTEALTKR